MQGRRELAYWRSTWATEDIAAPPPARFRGNRHCFVKPSQRSGNGFLTVAGSTWAVTHTGVVV